MNDIEAETYLCVSRVANEEIMLLLKKNNKKINNQH